MAQKTKESITSHLMRPAARVREKKGGPFGGRAALQAHRFSLQESNVSMPSMQQPTDQKSLAGLPDRFAPAAALSYCSACLKTRFYRRVAI
jgi:hypothetical protein